LGAKLIEGRAETFLLFCVRYRAVDLVMVFGRILVHFSALRCSIERIEEKRSFGAASLDLQ
jgi:hypothetical protein